MTHNLSHPSPLLPPSTLRRLVVVAPAEAVPYDVSLAVLAFSSARSSTGARLYDVVVCGENTLVKDASFDMTLRHGLDALESADRVIVAGTRSILSPTSNQLSDALAAAGKRCIPIASICYAAFSLAAAGLLHERKATTHWLATDAFARQYPDTEVVRDVLFIDSGEITTSAGGSAGLDMCLHLVKCDFGADVSRRAAELIVAPIQRSGDQAQVLDRRGDNRDGVAALLDWMIVHSNQNLTVGALAARLNLTERTFTRKFKSSTGATPIQWLLRQRIAKACTLLETSARTIEDVATTVGFESGATFRARFQSELGMSPSKYRLRLT